MKKSLFWVVIGIFFLAGCSSLPPQQNVTLESGVWDKKPKIGVYINPTPKITTSFPGANCLLCFAAAALANSSLTKQVETFQPDQLASLRDNVVARLQEKGVEVVVIEKLIPESKLPKVKATALSTLKRHYGPYKKQYGVDQLLVINYRAGVDRSYSSYIPMGEPLVVISGQFYMIDLHTNQYTMYDPLSISIGAEGEWDAPPTFPGITNAFYQAEEAAVDHVMAPLN